MGRAHLIPAGPFVTHLELREETLLAAVSVLGMVLLEFEYTLFGFISQTSVCVVHVMKPGVQTTKPQERVLNATIVE